MRARNATRHRRALAERETDATTSGRVAPLTSAEIAAGWHDGPLGRVRMICRPVDDSDGDFCLHESNWPNDDLLD